MSLFAPRVPGDVARFVRAHPLGLVVSHGTAGFASTPLPLLPVVDAGDVVVELFGHFALANPQVEAIRANPAVHIVFQGPQGYIRPAWVPQPGWAPTWNYALVRFDAELRFVPEENDRAIRDLVAAMEGDGPGAWTTQAMGPRYDQLVRRIIAFRARVTRIHATFKLGQDEDDAVFREILTGLGDDPLARTMAAQSPDKLAG